MRRVSGAELWLMDIPYSRSKLRALSREEELVRHLLLPEMSRETVVIDGGGEDGDSVGLMEFLTPCFELTRLGHSNKDFCTKPPIKNSAFRNSGADEAVRNWESDAVFKERDNSQIEVSFGKLHVQGTSGMHKQKFSSQHVYSRSLCAAKLGSSAWPLLDSISDIGHINKEECESIRPSLMAFGTLDGQVVVINDEKGNLVGYIPCLETDYSFLGLCWLKKYPSKLPAGSGNGSWRLYDIKNMQPTVPNSYCTSMTITFDNFELLTSGHVNSSEEQILTSGY
ncbi:hypothetical protein LguiB_014140 [Lonicera macranthoides]